MPVSIDRRRFALLAGSLAVVPAAAVRPAAAADGLAIARAYIAAWNAHDAAKAADFLAEDATYFDASVGTPVTGRDEARTTVIEAFLNAAPDAKWEARDSFAAGDRVAFEWTFSGTNTGDWADGTKATGKPFSFIGATVMRIADGKIAYQGDYYDALGFYKQLGLM